MFLLVVPIGLHAFADLGEQGEQVAFKQGEGSMQGLLPSDENERSVDRDMLLSAAPEFALTAPQPVSLDGFETAFGRETDPAPGFIAIKE